MSRPLILSKVFWLQVEELLLIQLSQGTSSRYLVEPKRKTQNKRRLHRNKNWKVKKRQGPSPSPQLNLFQRTSYILHTYEIVSSYTEFITATPELFLWSFLSLLHNRELAQFWSHHSKFLIGKCDWLAHPIATPDQLSLVKQWMGFPGPRCSLSYNWHYNMNWDML